MKRSFLIWILLFFPINNLYAQNKMIKGRVIDEYLETLPYVLILINDSVKIGKTDLNGFFQVNIPIYTKNILFKVAKMDLSPIELVDSCNEVEIVMMASGTYDFITLKKVRRLQLKRFKKLPKLHEKAFEKGIFNTINACYKQKYIFSRKKSL